MLHPRVKFRSSAMMLTTKLQSITDVFENNEGGYDKWLRIERSARDSTEAFVAKFYVNTAGIGIRNILRRDRLDDSDGDSRLAALRPAQLTALPAEARPVLLCLL